jgi:hypothetical protein
MVIFEMYSRRSKFLESRTLPSPQESTNFTALFYIEGLVTRVQIHDTPRHICEYGMDRGPIGTRVAVAPKFSRVPGARYRGARTRKSCQHSTEATTQRQRSGAASMAQAAFPNDVLPSEGTYDSREALLLTINSWAKPRG